MATTLKEGVDLVNTSLKTLGYEYQIDTTSAETMTDGLSRVGAYPPSVRNAIMEQMNLVLQQRNYGVMFNSEKNKFRTFLVDMTTAGFGVEDIFHELAEGIEPLWDKKGTTEQIVNDLYSYDSGKVHKFFHTTPMEREFKATIDRRNYDKVFTETGVTRYIDTKIANMQWSAEVWLMRQIIGQVQKMVADRQIVFSTGVEVNTKDGVNNAVERLKATVSGFKTPSSLFNYGVPEVQTDGSTIYRSVVNMTPDEDYTFIVTTPELLERLKVQGYSNAFNLSQYELEGRVILLPAGTSLGTYNEEEVLFVVLDRRAILAGIKTWMGTSKFIENTGTMNHFLLIDGISGYNTVFNAVAFTGEKLKGFFTAENYLTYLTFSLTEEGGDQVSYADGVLGQVLVNGSAEKPLITTSDTGLGVSDGLLKVHPGDTVTFASGSRTIQWVESTTAVTDGSTVYVPTVPVCRINITVTPE